MHNVRRELHVGCDYQNTRTGTPLTVSPLHGLVARPAGVELRSTSTSLPLAIAEWNPRTTDIQHQVGHPAADSAHRR